MTIRLYDQHSTSFDFNPGASLPFADIAELAAFDDRQVSDGGLAYTSTVRSLWIKRVVSPVPTADGITIVATASGDGAWYRSTAPSLSWQSQATWYIDPAAGDDENDGSASDAAHALATWAEFTRRIETISLPTTVTILSDIAESLVGHFTGANETASLTIAGQPTVLASGGGAGHSTLTDPVPATNSRGLVSVDNLTTSAGDAAVLSTYVGKMLRCPATDANGVYLAPALRASGNDVNVPWWTRVNISNTKPVNDTLVEVLDLVTCPTVQISADTLPVQVRLLEMTSTNTRLTPIVSTSLSLDVQTTSPSVWGSWFGCIVPAFLASSAGGRSAVFACLFTGAVAIGALYPMGGRVTLVGGGATKLMQVANSGIVAFQGFVIDGGRLQVGTSSRSTATALAEVVSSTISLGVFGATGNAIEVQGGAQLRAGGLFGSGSTGYGIAVSSGGRVLSVDTPTITGTSGDVSLSAATSLAATNVVPIRDGVPTAPAIAMTTWATWAAARPGGLERYAVNLADGSAITGG